MFSNALHEIVLITISCNVDINYFLNCTYLKKVLSVLLPDPFRVVISTFKIWWIPLKSTCHQAPRSLLVIEQRPIVKRSVENSPLFENLAKSGSEWCLCMKSKLCKAMPFNARLGVNKTAINKLTDFFGFLKRHEATMEVYWN